MFANQAAEYALNRPSKCLKAIGSRSCSRFLVGSCSPSDYNELIMLRHVEDMNELLVDATFPLGSSMDVLSTCNYDPAILVTSSHHPNHHSSMGSTATVYRIPTIAFQQQDEEDYDDEYDNSANHEEEDRLYSSNRPRLMTDTSTKTNSGVHDLQPVMDLTSSSSTTSPVSCMVWNPDCMPDDDYGDDDEAALDRDQQRVSPSCSSNHHFLTLQANNVVCTYDMSRDDGATNATIHPTNNNNQRPFYLPKAAWNPHDPSSVAVTNYFQKSFNILDLRSSSVQANIPTEVFACDVDYNPNKPFMFATGMSDGTLRFWDLRYTASSILQKQVRGGHTHWASSIQYNPYHDQLILSGGTDAKLNLWRISSISSAPLLELEDDDPDIPNNMTHDSDDQHDDDYDSPNVTMNDEQDDDDDYHKEEKDDRIVPTKTSTKRKKKNEQDIRVCHYDMSESIYNVTWSAADAWYFCSLSYDGHVTLNHVPSKEKYKILL